MPRRYQQDSEGNTRRVWNGKFPEDFTSADTLLFMAETDRELKEKEARTMSENTEKAPAPLDFKVSVRPIEPKGNLVGFASVCFADSFVVDDF